MSSSLAHRLPSPFLLGLALAFAPNLFAKEHKLLNVSYDPTRELYQEYNPAFAKHWKGKTGEDVAFSQSHGGSGKQARAIIDGLQADVATLALAYDIEIIAERAKSLPRDWQKGLPHNSAPYWSTIVFLVRKGNPKGIRDWEDLGKPGVAVVCANPKTGGGARWNYLAAWGAALKAPGGDESKARDLVKRIYRNVVVLDAAARGTTNTFLQRGIGDVAVVWENEAFLALREFSQGGVEIVVPTWSILAEPTVAVIEKNAIKKGNAEVAKAYLEYLYSEEGQDIIGRHYFRPRSEAAIAKYASQYPKVHLFTIDELFGGWKKAQKTHFDDGGIFDTFFSQP